MIDEYDKTTVQPISLKRIMPIDASLARTVRYWWGSFGESYAFYSVGNKVYRFDYYNMKEFNPAKSKLLISLDEGEQLVDVFPLVPGLGLRGGGLPAVQHWLGVVGLFALVVESAMFDWSGLYFESVLQVPKSLQIGFLVFMVMMTVGRFLMASIKP